MSKPLTPKQEKFAQCMADGMNRIDAYRASYDASKMSDRSVTQKSYELLNNGDITVRISEIKNKLAERTLWTREDSVNKLKEALDIADRPNDIVSVIKELNAMHGFNAPIKQEIEHKGAVQIFVPDMRDDL